MAPARPPTPRWPDIVAAARACVGTRFRPQGRVPGLGLDCVGVVLVAAAAAGVLPARVPAYRLGGTPPDVDGVFAACGASAVDAALPGDVLVLVPAPGQRHFGVVTALGLVHAHAGLDRVVEGPVDPDWRVTGAWRLPGAR
jgi:murein DD-endopeptidase / murein LD-carboxypeptidase